MSPKPISPLLRAWYTWKALRLPWRKKFLIGLDLNGNTYWEFRDLGRGPTLSSSPSHLSPSSSPSPSPSSPFSIPSPSPRGREEQIRWRRIVRPAGGSSTHHADVRVPPQWHQWLRHARAAPPSLEEQRGEEARRARMRVLAAQADARWAAKARVGEVEREGTTPGGAGVLPGAAVGATTAATSGGGGPAGVEVKRDGEEEEVVVDAGKGSKPAATPSPQASGAEAQKAASPASAETKKGTAAPTASPPKMDTDPEADSKDDPWKRARGGPSEDWQPQAWTPSPAPRRR